MTKFHTDDGELLITDPFDGTEMQRRIVITPTRETKYPLGRAIPTAFWVSYFTLHWLTILGVVPTCVTTSGITIWFLGAAVLTTMLVTAFEATNDK